VGEGYIWNAAIERTRIAGATVCFSKSSTTTDPCLLGFLGLDLLDLLNLRRRFLDGLGGLGFTDRAMVLVDAVNTDRDV